MRSVSALAGRSDPRVLSSPPTTQPSRPPSSFSYPSRILPFPTCTSALVLQWRQGSCSAVFGSNAWLNRPSPRLLFSSLPLGRPITHRNNPAITNMIFSLGGPSFLSRCAAARVPSLRFGQTDGPSSSHDSISTAMQVARKIPTDDPEVLFYLRIAYISIRACPLLHYHEMLIKGAQGADARLLALGTGRVELLTVGAYAYISYKVCPPRLFPSSPQGRSERGRHGADACSVLYLQVKAKNDNTKLKYVQPASPMVRSLSPFSGLPQPTIVLQPILTASLLAMCGFSFRAEVRARPLRRRTRSTT
jgi:hypothetical protein